MLSEKQEQEYHVLDIIEGSTNPVGSGTIREQLRNRGIDLSEATVGRMLRELDNSGYTAKVGFQGRVLTPNGKNRLAELRQEREWGHFGIELINSLRLKDKQDLIEVLVARRAIEGEIARLAAIHATPEEIRHMRQVLEFSQRQIQAGHSGAQQDVEFHQALARAARNKVLSAAMDLIRRDSQLTPVLEYIRCQVKGDLVADHMRILQAVAEHQPELAVRAMVDHIEGLISDVEKYWSEVHPSGAETKRTTGR